MLVQVEDIRTLIFEVRSWIMVYHLQMSRSIVQVLDITQFASGETWKPLLLKSFDVFTESHLILVKLDDSLLWADLRVLVIWNRWLSLLPFSISGILTRIPFCCTLIRNEDLLSLNRFRSTTGVRCILLRSDKRWLGHLVCRILHLFGLNRLHDMLLYLSLGLEVVFLLHFVEWINTVIIDAKSLVDSAIFRSYDSLICDQILVLSDLHLLSRGICLFLVLDDILWTLVPSLSILIFLDKLGIFRHHWSLFLLCL